VVRGDIDSRPTRSRGWVGEWVVAASRTVVGAISCRFSLLAFGWYCVVYGNFVVGKVMLEYAKN